MMPPAPRYAIYFTPPAAHPLTRAAVAWLGRDAFAPAGAPPPDARTPGFLADPRRYGFHATLKAPFRLGEGATEADLRAALGAFAAGTPACPLGRLRVAPLGSFLALMPDHLPPALLDFASRIVMDFDRFRAPSTAAELARRRQAPLDARESALLEQWGYPYVLDRFRFHMSLTGRVGADLRPALLARLEARFAGLLDAAFHIDALTLFVEEAPGADFAVVARYPLRGALLQDGAA